MEIKQISYSELCEDQAGLARWEETISRIKEIAANYPKAFNSEVVNNAIPYDAKQNRCYVALNTEGKIVAFLIATIEHFEAELLWGAKCPKQTGHDNPHYFDELATYVENALFDESECPHFKILIKVATHDSTIPDMGAHDRHSRMIFRYHRRRGYRFQYRLEDYFTSGNHVAVLVKRRSDAQYGYLDFKKPALVKTTREQKHKDHIPVQREIQKIVRDYLSSFYDEFSGLHKAKDGSSKGVQTLDGFFGVAFVPEEEADVTLFSDTTRPLDNLDKFKPRFEYSPRGSVFTQILTASELPQTGVVHYPIDFDDTQNEISVNEYFRTFLPDLQSKQGYSIFFFRSRRPDQLGNNSYAILYLVVPFLKNVVVAKRNWLAFSRYADNTLMGIYEVLKTITETRFPDNSYLKHLMACIDVPPKYGRLDDLFGRMRVNKGIAEGEVKTKRHFAHELNTPLTALYGERENLSENGKLALDYISLWQRFAGNTLGKYELPESVKAMFADDQKLLANIINLSLKRVSQEGKVPKYGAGKKTTVSAKDLTNYKDAWLEAYQISLDPAYEWICNHMPPESANKCRKMIQTLVLSLSIGAFHHLLEYVFLKTILITDSLQQAFGNCQKGGFEIFAVCEDASLEVVVQNTGSDITLDNEENLSSEKFGSNRIGQTYWQLDREWYIHLQPFGKIETIDEGKALWQASICVKKGVEYEHNIEAVPVQV